ncbi:MAG: hypothetical protein ACUVTL_00275 [Thermoproteota archaeon]
MSRHIPEIIGPGLVPINVPMNLNIDSAHILGASNLMCLDEVDPLEICFLPRCDEETMVVGLDASAFCLGECDRGALVVVRAAMVSKTRSTKYRARRFGPIPFLVPFLGDDPKAQDPMSFLEGYIKDYVSGNVSDSIILWDGRLQLIDSFLGGLEHARENGNVIVALSKEAISYYHPINDKIRELDHPFVAILGSDRLKTIVATRLEARGLVLRAEHFPSKTHEKVAEDFSRIVANDLLESGYPETLRLAHILCKFSPTEVIGLRRAVREKTSIELRRKNDTRKIIFGALWG